MYRYGVQVDVLQQLGGKLETSLRQQETQLNQTPRTEAAKRRATLIKLNRDFRRIEGVFKNMVLDTRNQKSRAPDPPKQQYQHDGGAGGEYTEEEQRMQLELQLQQDVSCSVVRYFRTTSNGAHSYRVSVSQRLNEEIMREREHEIRNINRGMHQVNEIYKVCANVESV